MEMQVEIRFKKCGISNQPNVCIFDDPCFSKFGALRGSCPHPGRQFVDFCAALACTPAIKHNRAKPMSESASALFSIADAGEFRFARFYIVCEEVPLGTPESPPIVSGVSDMHPSDCPNVEETRNPMQTFGWKKCSHFSPTNIPSAFPHEIPKCVSHNITYQRKARYAYCGSPFNGFLRRKRLFLRAFP